MTDEAKALVERLRWGAWYYEDPFDGKAYASDDPLEAADLIETQAREIERLNAILSEINDTDVIAKTMAENERLRATELTDVELEEALTAVGIGVYGPDAERFEKMFAAAMTARAALAGDSHDQ